MASPSDSQSEGPGSIPGGAARVQKAAEKAAFFFEATFEANLS